MPRPARQDGPLPLSEPATVTLRVQRAKGRSKSYRLDLVSSTEFSNGTVGLHYRRHR